MSSSSNKKNQDHSVFDLEQQFILRLPPGPSIALRRDVQSGQMNLKDKLSIEIHNDNRHATVCYGGQMLSAKLVDLPCIIESLKTTDKKTLYKTADISQLMIASADRDFKLEDEEDVSKKSDKDKHKKFVWNHGVTFPLKNVRKRRFRKTLKKKVVDMSDIEKEVKRLFRTDNEAIDVKWELITDDSKSSDPAGQSAANKAEASSAATSQAIAEHIFGELSSSEDEDDKDINIMDSGDEEASRLTPRMDPSLLMSEDTMQSLADMSLPPGDLLDSTVGDGDISQPDFQTKLNELETQLDDLRARKQAQEAEIEAVDNQALKQRFQSSLDSILQEEATKQKEYEILASMVGQ